MFYEDPRVHKIWGENIHHGLWEEGDDFDAAMARANARIVNAFDAPTRVIDIGCGLGGLSRDLARVHGCEVVGVDISERMIATARSLTDDPRVTFERADAFDLPFHDGWFDAVLMVDLLVYLDPRIVALEEAARVLAPRGQVVIVDLRFDDQVDLHPFEIEASEDWSSGIVPTLREVRRRIDAIDPIKGREHSCTWLSMIQAARNGRFKAEFYQGRKP